MGALCLLDGISGELANCVPLNNPDNNVDPILHQFANLTNQYRNKACTPTEYGFSYSKKAMAHNACEVNFVVSSITIVGSFCNWDFLTKILVRGQVVVSIFHCLDRFLKLLLLNAKDNFLGYWIRLLHQKMEIKKTLTTIRVFFPFFRYKKFVNFFQKYQN